MLITHITNMRKGKERELLQNSDEREVFSRGFDKKEQKNENV